jgi:hypothetical protein
MEQAMVMAVKRVKRKGNGVRYRFWGVQGKGNGT